MPAARMASACLAAATVLGLAALPAMASASPATRLRTTATCPAQPRSAQVSGLAARYKFDETSGPVIDYSGNGLDGYIDTPNSGHKLADNLVRRGAPGYHGYAAGFSISSSTGQEAEISVPEPTASPLNPGRRAVYISVYLKKSGTSTGDYNVVQKGTANTPGGAYKLEVGYKSPHVNVPDCEFSGKDSQGALAHQYAYGPTSMPINQSAWRHVECLIGPHGHSAIWVDGVRTGSVVSGSTLHGGISNHIPLSIGGKPDPHYNRDRHSYVGYLDNVCIVVGEASVTTARTYCD